MTRTHAQQFANRSLARAAFADPLAFARALAGDPEHTLAAVWDEAAAELAPIARTTASGFSAMLERRGRYLIAIVTPPAPRESGDPVAIAIIGRGDGSTSLSALAYYVLELVLDPATGAPSFALVSRTGLDAEAARWDGPLPDPRWFADHAFAIYTGRAPDSHAGIPRLPSWYWWYAFDGAAAMRRLGDAVDDAARFDAMRAAPILLLPEIADSAELYLGAAAARRLHELRPFLLRGESNAASWHALVRLLVGARAGSPAAHCMRALPLVADAARQGALTRAQWYELEATLRSKLALLGIETADNHALAGQLFAAARAAETAPRVARGSIPPPISAEDPVWKPLFLDETDLPRYARAEHDDAFSTSDPAFVAHGGVRAGLAVWTGDERSALARIVDTRWVFRTATAAAAFMRATAAALGDGLQPLAPPQLGDDALAFGDEGAGRRRTHVLVVRTGRVLARLEASEGAHAAASRQILHAAMIQPLAAAIVQRARRAIAAYWLHVASATNAVASLVHSNGYDAARLLQRFPLLAHDELPAALAVLGEPYAPAARALASFQAQLRAHRWTTYREAMRALVRALLDNDMGDPRVNAGHAWEIVTELRYLDPDPIWMQLDAECRARG